MSSLGLRTTTARESPFGGEGPICPRIRQDVRDVFSGIPIIHLWQFMILIWFWCNRHLKKELKGLLQRLRTLEFQWSNQHGVVMYPVVSIKNWHSKKQVTMFSCLAPTKMVFMSNCSQLRRQPQFRSFTSGFFKNGSDSTRSQIKSDT